jgi:hypothetical protein
MMKLTTDTSSVYIKVRKAILKRLRENVDESPSRFTSAAATVTALYHFICSDKNGLAGKDEDFVVHLLSEF